MKVRTIHVIGSIAVLLALALPALVAAPASASMQVDAFETTSSDTQAGGHPDLTTSFTLHEPGVTESAANVIFDAPEGLFGNPSAALRCTASDFALDRCASNSQAGLVTVYANHNGHQGELLGTSKCGQAPTTACDSRSRN